MPLDLLFLEILVGIKIRIVKFLEDCEFLKFKILGHALNISSL